MTSKKTAFEPTLEFAREQDRIDPLAHIRDRFHIPPHGDGKAYYFCGNSLGLQTKSTADYIRRELEIWAEKGVEGHFERSADAPEREPWFSYHKMFSESLARLCGAQPDEVVSMNQLTVNLHLLMVSFFRPNGKRCKILTEGGAFPSDQYALETQLRHHGLDPAETLIELWPRDGEHTLRTEDITAQIDAAGDELALVMMAGVQYYTGQLFDMQAITAAAHRNGALAGFDLAHAMGNVELSLHAWDVDFATWCSYKYLNSGPGGVSGVFVHEKHGKDPSTPRFAGWWGNRESERFEMKKGFRPAPGAQGWQMSNAPVLSMAAHRAALDVFDEVGMAAISAKRTRLTAWMEFLIDCIRAGNPAHMPEVITPRATAERGAQLSIIVPSGGRAVFDKLTAGGCVLDWREPDVIRGAPAPLYNSFEDVWHFGSMLADACGVSL